MIRERIDSSPRSPADDGPKGGNAMQDAEFEEIYTRYHRVVYAYLISLCRSEE